MPMNIEDIADIADLPTARPGEYIRVRLARYGSVVKLDIRQWYTGEDDELHPTSKGTTVGLKSLDSLVAAIEKAKTDPAVVEALGASKSTPAKKATAKKAAPRKAVAARRR